MLLDLQWKKLVGCLFDGGTESIQNFHKGEIYLIGEISSENSFRLGKFLSPSQYFLTFPRQNSSDIMNIFDLS